MKKLTWDELNKRINGINTNRDITRYLKMRKKLEREMDRERAEDGIDLWSAQNRYKNNND
jgi:predicted transcriptional regulator